AVAEPFVVGRIGILDARTGNELVSMPGHGGMMLGLTILPDGTVMTSAMDRSVRWWDPETGRELRQQRNDELRTWVLPANIRADGRGLFVMENKDVVHIDLASGAKTRVTTEKPNPVNLIHGVSGSAVFVNTPDRKVRLWDARTGQTVQTYDP